MNSKKEKLSLLAEMIQFAKSDNALKDSEYDFLLAVASQIGIDKQELDRLFDEKVDRVPLKPESQRILQFHRLVLLMNVDQEASASELEKIRDMGIKMGLNPLATNKVLDVMHNYPNKVVPPNVLIDIFSTYYN